LLTNTNKQIQAFPGFFSYPHAFVSLAFPLSQDFWAKVCIESDFHCIVAKPAEIHDTWQNGDTKNARTLVKSPGI